MSNGEVAKKEVAAGRRAPDLDKLEAKVTRLEVRPGGRTAYFLDNGQVWRQLLLCEDPLLRPGDSVTISRGVLGSFNLHTATGRGCKVKRVR